MSSHNGAEVNGKSYLTCKQQEGNQEWVTYPEPARLSRWKIVSDSSSAVPGPHEQQDGTEDEIEARCLGFLMALVSVNCGLKLSKLGHWTESGLSLRLQISCEGRRNRVLYTR